MHEYTTPLRRLFAFAGQIELESTMTHYSKHLMLIAGIAGVLLAATPASAQRANMRINHEALDVPSGTFNGDGQRENIAFIHVFAQPRAPWMRLHIGDSNLGSNSFIVLRSMTDNGEQRLNARTLEQWQNATAIFNGDRVMLELHIAPEDEGVFVEFDQVIYGEPLRGYEGGIATACGADNRVASTDNRVGRLYFGGCTAWRTTAGVFLTAGHCVDSDPDQGGPAVPNGVLDLSGVVEFNVPASTAGGNTIAANPNDQYPILTNNVAWSRGSLRVPHRPSIPSARIGPRSASRPTATPDSCPNRPTAFLSG
jgi:hypothetical protein